MPTDLRPYDEEGFPHGYWEIYYDNGQLDYRGEFINDLKHGLHESYLRDGRLFSIGTYNMGKKVGIWFEYRHNGRLRKKLFYAN